MKAQVNTHSCISIHQQQCLILQTLIKVNLKNWRQKYCYFWYTKCKDKPSAVLFFISDCEKGTRFTPECNQNKRNVMRDWHHSHFLSRGFRLIINPAVVSFTQLFISANWKYLEVQRMMVIQKIYWLLTVSKTFKNV